MSPKKQKVLIADDNELNLQLFSDLLLIKGVEIIPVMRGEEVIKTASEHHPDLIISDIRLGKVSGVHIIKDIKDTPEIAEIPIVAITAYVTAQDKKDLEELGCLDYLSKPVPIADFYKVVGKYIEI